MNKWIDFEEWCREQGLKVYQCMVCKKKYSELSLPTVGGKGDGCCEIGSLIELR